MKTIHEGFLEESCSGCKFKRGSYACKNCEEQLVNEIERSLATHEQCLRVMMVMKQLMIEIGKNQKMEKKRFVFENLKGKKLNQIYGNINNGKE